VAQAVGHLPSDREVLSSNQVLPKKERRKEGGVGDLAQWKSACLASANPEFGPQHRKKKKKEGRKE
jgi:hypothetical protein